MKTLAATCLLVFTLLTMPGCKSVTSDHLIGAPIEDKEAGAFEGAWKLDNNVLHIKQTDGANLIVAGLNWDNDTKSYSVKQFKLVITQLDENRYAQVVVEDEDKDADADGQTPAMDKSADTDKATPDAESKPKPWLLVGLLVKSGNDALVLYSPNFKRYEKAINDGELKGTVDQDGNDMHITADQADLDAFFSNHPMTELFQMDNPGVVTRIPNAE